MNNFEDPSLIAAIEAASLQDSAVPGQTDGVTGSRLAVLHNVFFSSNPAWFQPFAVMLVLSSGVATLGLSQNSAATVIGAMLIAPLASPIVALGGAIVLGWPRVAFRMSVLVILGALTVVAVGYGLGLFLPTETPTDQILARTNPDLRDLGVGLLAGAAGAYALTRKEFFTVLAGVAIAVALVPPLSAVGLLLEDGRPLLAQGALLLFSANLVGITLAASLVMIITGYAPRPRLPRSLQGIVLGLMVVVVTAVVAGPLFLSYMHLSDQAARLTAVNQTVAAVVGPGSAPVVGGVQVNGDEIVVDIAEAGAGFDPDQLAQALEAALGPNAKVTVNTR